MREPCPLYHLALIATLLSLPSYASCHLTPLTFCPHCHLALIAISRLLPSCPYCHFALIAIFARWRRCAAAGLSAGRVLVVSPMRTRRLHTSEKSRLLNNRFNWLVIKRVKNLGQVCTSCCSSSYCNLEVPWVESSLPFETSTAPNTLPIPLFLNLISIFILIRLWKMWTKNSRKYRFKVTDITWHP